MTDNKKVAGAESDEPDDDDDVEYVIEEEKKKPEPLDDDEDQGDRRLAEGGEVDVEIDDDGKPEEDLEAKRARRREEKKRQRQRRRQMAEEREMELDHLKRIIAESQRVNADLQRKMVEREAKDLDARLGWASSAYQAAEREYAQAVTANNGEAAALADRKKQQASAAYHEARELKQRAAPVAPQQQPIHPAHQRYANEVFAEAPWYKPDGSNQQSRILLAIDNGLANEGWDPTTRAYWDELRDRARKRIPGAFQKKPQSHESDDDDDDEDDEPSPRRKGPPVGGGSSTKASVGVKRTITLSAERVAAIKQAGCWEDPEARKRMIKAYERYDRENKSR